VSGKTGEFQYPLLWDGEPGQALRLFFSIDDGGVRAFAPLTRGALVSPGQAFDGELH
jgi:hypothetical protein